MKKLLTSVVLATSVALCGFALVSASAGAATCQAGDDPAYCTPAAAIPPSQAEAGFTVTSGGTTIIPIACVAVDGSCAVTGTISTATPLARVVAARTTTIAVIKKVTVKAGSTKKVKVTLPKAVIKRLQKQKITKLKVTVKLRSKASDGTVTTSTQKTTLRIPKAKAKKKPAFTG